MSHPLFLVDAFVDQPFSGNPAGICILDREQPASWMQNVALEMNQAETAFVHKRADGSWNLRWFTPTVEVSLCGHATLAAAHALWHHAGETAATLEFHTRSGRLTATRIGDEIQLDFPADFPQSIAQVPPQLVQLLGQQPHWFGQGREYLLAVVDHADTVRNFIPNNELIAVFTPIGLILTAAGDQGVDMVSRFFAPNHGIPEDPVTGSAHCLLACYWGNRLDKTHLRAQQASPRGGLLTLDWQGERVLLSGKARTMLTGEFHG
ncbi:PhzF family phenazine biosynthesis protein [Cellvibrio sp. OA-2007]|uniref:PhzF family phenazine biosynthesis protein n=1 Tax=Cellvibrio sp. OA-2007 TaxID=529823 RepID=UPI0007835E14|nr:PhzF family phenazine biosynthesis protein [Cellvibrio sp. OA-2007]